MFALTPTNKEKERGKNAATETTEMALVSLLFDIRSIVTTFLRTKADGFPGGHCAERKRKYMTGVLQDWCYQKILSERVSIIKKKN